MPGYRRILRYFVHNRRFSCRLYYTSLFRNINRLCLRLPAPVLLPLVPGAGRAPPSSPDVLTKRGRRACIHTPSGLSFLFLRLIVIIKAIIDALYLSAEVIYTIFK